MFVFICLFPPHSCKTPLASCFLLQFVFLCRIPTALSPLAGLLYRDQQQPASCPNIAVHSTHTHNDTASNKWRCLSTDFNLDFAPSTSRRWKLIFIYKLWDLRFSWFQTFALFCMFYVFFWVIPQRLNFICRRFRKLCLFHLHRQVGV